MAKLTVRDAADGLPLLRRLWREQVASFRPQLVGILALVLLIAAATSLYPILIKLAFDAFTPTIGEQSETAAGAMEWLRQLLSHLSGAVQPIHVIAVLVIVVTSVKGFSVLGQVVLTNSVVSRVEARMQAALYGHLVEADLAQLQAENAAALTQRFTTDFLYIREALTRLVNIAVRDLVTAIALVGAMLWIDWQLTLVVVLVAPLVAGPIARIGKRLRRVSTSHQEQTGQMAALVMEGLQGARFAKTDQLEPYLKARASAAFEAMRKLKMKAVNARGRLEPLLEVGGGFAVAAVLLVIGFRVGTGTGTVGDFTGYVTALLLAAQPLRSIGNLNAIVQEALAALRRYYDIMDRPPRIVSPPGASDLEVSGGEIAFEDLSFGYREGQAAVSGIDLVVPAGRTTALVGRSGSGKSTLMALVPRLHDPVSGAVRIDGQDISKVSLASLRRQIAVVSQDVVLFDESIAANIAFARPGASEAEIRAAARAAAADRFIEKLPQGYDTRVGERGHTLSGGERQRISLARAILKDAPILLLDEATSALDSESEQLVQEALTELMKGRTALVIAHRLSTVREADQIVVLDQGRIAEIGTHDALLARDGLYARLHKLQLLEA